MRRLKALWTRSRGADRRPGHTTRPGRRPAPIGTIDWNGDERRAIEEVLGPIDWEA